MRCLLRFFEFRIPSIDSLRLCDEARLDQVWSELAGFEPARRARYFGTADRLRPVNDRQVLLHAFCARKVASYSFADVQNLRTSTPSIHWSMAVKRALFAVSLAIDAQAPDVAHFADELVALDRLLLKFVEDGEVDFPFSCVEVPSARFPLPRPPRLFGRFSTHSLVDVVDLHGRFDADEAHLVEALKTGELIRGAGRSLDERLAVIHWGDCTQHSVTEILTKRYEWYARNGQFPIDSSFNELGDKEVSLFGAEPVEGLTGYSAASASGLKALVVDSPDEARPELERLAKLLHSGETAEGLPLRALTVLVPSRDDALSLQKLAREFELPVAYVGDDDRLWNPFPPDYEGGDQDDAG